MHVNDAARNRVNIARFRWINELRRAEVEPDIFEIETISVNWQEAEQFWIAYYKSIGANLCNATAGGDGIEGFRHSDDSRRKRSIAMTAIMRTPGVREKYGMAIKAAYANPETRARLKNSLAGSWTPARRAANAEFMKSIANLPSKIAATSRTHKGKVMSAHTRSLLSAALKGRKRSPEAVAASANGHRGRKYKQGKG